MKILYHHRTRATDAQRIHINEMIDAFRLTGNEVEEVSLVSATADQQDVTKEAREAGTDAKLIPGPDGATFHVTMSEKLLLLLLALPVAAQGGPADGYDPQLPAGFHV